MLAARAGRDPLIPSNRRARRSSSDDAGRNAFAREARQAGVLATSSRSRQRGAGQAVRMAAEGAHLPATRARGKACREPDAATPDDLSERELEDAAADRARHTNNEIAEQLYLSVRTVESHRAHIQQKLAITTAPSSFAMRSSRLSTSRFSRLVRPREQRDLGPNLRPDPWSSRRRECGRGAPPAPACDQAKALLTSDGSNPTPSSRPRLDRPARGTPVRSARRAIECWRCVERLLDSRYTRSRGRVGRAPLMRSSKSQSISSFSPAGAAPPEPATPPRGRSCQRRRASR